MRTKDIVFAVGPAGTGKNLHGCCVCREFICRRKKLIVLFYRGPAVEAGERLGFFAW